MIPPWRPPGPAARLDGPAGLPGESSGHTEGISRFPHISRAAGLPFCEVFLNNEIRAKRAAGLPFCEVFLNNEIRAKISAVSSQAIFMKH
jgi:hypothetical protein